MIKTSWEAPERNKGPILEVLSRVLPRSGTLLELASGTGQHAVHFARSLPGLRFVPSDIDPENLASIAAWRREANLPNLEPPRAIDVTAPSWDVGAVEAIYNANLIHIAPWAAAVGLFEGIERHLVPGGVAVVYGPFRIGGEHTAPSNAAFDQSLRARNASWGVRDLEAVVELAARAGAALSERVPMPANNQALVFVRSAAG
jgi:SAM-dependent methyltransferase